MTQDQMIIVGILLATIAMFVWGRWRHDMVAAGALLACVLAGLTTASEAFQGFGHPAVVTVACVLILSEGLQTSGAVDMLTRRLPLQSTSCIGSIALLTVLAAVMSAFMNNVGALALLMPLVIKAAADTGVAPGKMLMPVAFGSILGGMTTLIGTPPNLIVSGFRDQAVGDSFAMFDFTPVGLSVAVVGVAFIAVVGWRLVPARERAGVEGFETAKYLTEAHIVEGGKMDGLTVHQADEEMGEADAQIVGLVRAERRVPAPDPRRRLRAGDILIIEAEPEGLGVVLSDMGLEVTTKTELQKAEDESKETDADSDDGDAERKIPVSDEDVVLSELAIMPGARIVGRSVVDIQLRARYGVNLLAVSRRGRRSTARLRHMTIREGDVLLVQGGENEVSSFSVDFGCVPLAERAMSIPDRHKAYLAIAIMAAAVGGAAFGLVPASISFAGGVLAMMALSVLPKRAVYQAVDWPVIVLLGALIPVADAMDQTGAADMVARFMLDHVAQGYAVAGLAVILVVTMTMSDFMNNAATAAVMCPIAIGTADKLDASVDPFLMAVAVGASCAFLTPIGHQNNTLILGPGGFQFGDYWRLGLPMEILVIAIGVPAILFVWPL